MCRSPARGDGIFIAEIYYCGVASEMEKLRWSDDHLFLFCA